jgi:hypothetical protein
MGRRAVAIVLLIAAVGLVGCSRLGRLELQVKELKGNVKFLGERSDAASQANQTLDASLKQATVALAAIKESQAQELAAQLTRTRTDCCGCPVAAFTFEPMTQTGSMTVRFVDRSQDTGDDLSNWAWTFGDEGTADVQSPTHTYNTSGRYVVRLTVTDARGCSSSAQQEISVPLPGAPQSPDPIAQDSLGWAPRRMEPGIALRVPKSVHQG